MKKTEIIAYVAAGLLIALIVACFAFLPAFNGDNPNESSGDPADTNVSVLPPSDTTAPTDTTDDTTITPPTVTDDEKTDSAPADTSAPPKVEDVTQEEVQDKTPTEENTESEDKVESGEKDKDTVQTGPSSGEDRNDELTKEDGDETTSTDNKVDKPVIEEDEKTTSDTDGKGDAEILDEETNVDGGNKDAPEYNPSIGGDNPFDDDTKTEIDDKPVEDYIGEGEDRPGEGVHF